MDDGFSPDVAFFAYFVVPRKTIVRERIPMKPAVRKRAHGFTLVEMLVVLALIGMLSAIVSVAVMHARRFSVRVECQEHLKQIGLAVSQIMLANQGAYPPLYDENGVPWWATVFDEMQGGVSSIDTDTATDGLQPPGQLPAALDVFHCRYGGALDSASDEADQTERGARLHRSISYGLNFDVRMSPDPDAGPDDERRRGIRYQCVDRTDGNYPALSNPPTTAADKKYDEYAISEIERPAEFILISEADTQAPEAEKADWTGGRISMAAINRVGLEEPDPLKRDDPPGNAPIVGRHGGYANVLFADQHVESIQVDGASFPTNINLNTPLWTLPAD